MVRGEPTAVVGASALFGEIDSAVHRFVSLRLPNGSGVLAVGAVIGIADFDSSTVAGLPSLLEGAVPSAVQSIRVQDRDFVLILDAARLIPPEIVASLGSRSVSDANQ